MSDTPEPPQPTAPEMSPEEAALWAARKERALRWRQLSDDLSGYPTVGITEETPETLAAVPPERAKKK